MSTTRREVLNNNDLLREFVSFCASAADVVTIKPVYVDLVQQVITTMANSFLQSQDMLERIVKNKGGDAQMTLRDKLKAYTSDTQSQILI